MRELRDAYEDGALEDLDIDPEDFEHWAEEQLRKEKANAFDAY
jgi:hypothetical protein